MSGGRIQQAAFVNTRAFQNCARHWLRDFAILHFEKHAPRRTDASAGRE
jgi:hypothetical protein